MLAYVTEVKVLRATAAQYNLLWGREVSTNVHTLKTRI